MKIIGINLNDPEISLSSVIKAINDEPELPGEMPIKMQLIIRKAMDKQDLDLIIELMRIVVRKTKEGIIERLTNL